MNNDKDRLLKEQLEAMLKKAHRSLAAAQREIEEGDYNFASSRAYYAVFYAMEAVLLTKSVVFSKHSGVISAFSRYFIKTAIFPKEFSKLIAHLFRERQTGDYGFDLTTIGRDLTTIGREEANEDIKIAINIVNVIIVYLNKEGFVEPII
ncbi:MAG: HEPN domain-containing protein [bacterium]